MANSPPDDQGDDGCPKCGSDDCEWESCYHCGGEGYFDLHDEDPVNFAENEEMEACDECDRRGGYLVCHSCIGKAKQAEAK
jgi:hypothetical protein